MIGRATILVCRLIKKGDILRCRLLIEDQNGQSLLLFFHAPIDPGLEIVLLSLS